MHEKYSCQRSSAGSPTEAGWRLAAVGRQDGVAEVIEARRFVTGGHGGSPFGRRRPLCFGRRPKQGERRAMRALDGADQKAASDEFPQEEDEDRQRSIRAVCRPTRSHRNCRAPTHAATDAATRRRDGGIAGWRAGAQRWPTCVSCRAILPPTQFGAINRSFGK